MNRHVALRRLDAWPVNKLFGRSMVVMTILGRGDWVAISVAAVVNSSTEGPDGRQWEVIGVVILDSPSQEKHKEK